MPGRYSYSVSANLADELCRFMIGFGLTFAAAAAPVLVTEIAYPSLRAASTSLYNSLWYDQM